MSSPKWVGLQDVEASHREAPRTFSIPRSDQRSRLRKGDLVKLVFEADEPSEKGWTAERMWVEVREVGPSSYVGTLDNEPSFISNLQAGASISFGPQHVAALYTSPSALKLPYGLSALVSRGIVENAAWPVEAERLTPESSESSGWVVRCEGSKAADLVPLMVDELIHRFRVLDSVLDEPVGTRWLWDSDRVEYTLQPAEEA